MILYAVQNAQILYILVQSNLGPVFSFQIMELAINELFFLSAGPIQIRLTDLMYVHGIIQQKGLKSMMFLFKSKFLLCLNFNLFFFYIMF